MRQTGTRGYTGYHGRRSSGRRWLIALLVLVLLAAAAFFVAQRYIVYEMNGTFRFELPWRRESADAPSSARKSGQELEIVIERPEEPEAPAMHAQELGVSALTGNMERTLGALPPTVNAVAIRVKTVDGELLYPSALPMAIEAHAVVGSSIARGNIDTLTASAYHTIARLNALHDSRFSFAHMTDAAILQKAYKNNIWYAPDSSHYLAPEKELSREYLCAIASEVAALGFDELLFDEFSYPVAGRLDNIDVSAREMTPQDALALLAANLREAVSDYDVLLSFVMDEETALAGGNEVSGQELAALAACFDRVYVPTAPERLDALYAALAPYDIELVPVLSEAAESGSYLLSAE